MTELAVYQPSAIMPAMNIQQALQRRDEMKLFVQGIMTPGTDYGKVPGTDKDTLLKPGAEKLSTFFGLTARLVIVKEQEVWGDYETPPFFYYWYKCQLYQGDRLVGEGDGSCNSHESKYRWRWVGEDALPPGLNPSTLKKRGGTLSEFTFAVEKAETSGKYGKPAEYWQSFKDAIADGTARSIKKKTRKGAQYDAWEIDSAVYRTPNDDAASQANTILKMAQKRALVAAVLVTVNASEYFTQDLEDFDPSDLVQGTVLSTAAAPRAPQPAQRPVQAQPTTTGAYTEADDLNDKMAYYMADEAVESNGTHWIDKNDTNGKPIRNRFWAWATGDGENSRALTKEQVYKALQVERIHDYPGTMGEAKEKIDQWIALQAEIDVLYPTTAADPEEVT